jgi:hypothetical protein
MNWWLWAGCIVALVLLAIAANRLRDREDE